jgi:hypothetical protein
VFAFASGGSRRASATELLPEAVTMDYQVTHSDVIARGTCEDAATTFSNKHFITTYKIAVRKYLKAPGKMTVTTDPTLTVSALGGRIEKPIPLSENIPEMAALYPGEQVVVFLQMPDNMPAAVKARYNQLLAERKLAPSPLMQNYRLTTLGISKLTVVIEPTTGRELVARLPFDRWGILGSPEMVKEFVQAYQAHKSDIPVKQGTRRMRMPITLSPLTQGNPTNIEQKIAQMRSYCATWENFQAQVEQIKNSSATAAPSLASR